MRCTEEYIVADLLDIPVERVGCAADEINDAARYALLCLFKIEDDGFLLLEIHRHLLRIIEALRLDDNDIHAVRCNHIIDRRCP